MKPHHHGPPRRPSIAITPDTASTTPEQAPRLELKTAYADAVFRAGGLPFVVPLTSDASVIDSYLERVSGLVVTGGHFDIPPELYGDQPREGLGPLKPDRTQFELALLKAALARHLPVLGICGGMQLLNVALGGTLVQDIGRELPQAKAHEQKHERTQPQHPVDVREGTLLAECVGKGQLMVNSTHHQAVKALGQGVTMSAAAPDGVVEAIELKGGGFVLGVQWHPELMIDTVPPHLGVYRTFISKARERRH